MEYIRGFSWFSVCLQLLPNNKYREHLFKPFFAALRLRETLPFARSASIFLSVVICVNPPALPAQWNRFCLLFHRGAIPKDKQCLSRGIAPQEHPKGFNWGVFNRGG
jgi:hypothetical protein